MERIARPKLRTLLLLALLGTGATLYLVSGLASAKLFWTDFGMTAFLVFLPPVLVTRIQMAPRRKVSSSVVSALVISTVLLGLLAPATTVLAAPDTYYLRDTNTTGVTPAGKEMSTAQGTGAATMAFASVGQEAYWYTDTALTQGVEAGSYTFNMHFNELPRSWWNGAYGYRQRINISAGSTSVPNGYSVKLTFDHAALAGDGRSQADGDDIRILRWTGSAWSELDRILASGSSWNTAATTILFETQAAISASGFDSDYYLYTGNTAATGPPTSTLPARFFIAESLGETQTSSTTYSNKVQLQFTPTDTSQHWVVVATWRQRHVGSLGSEVDLGESRITVNGGARTGTDEITFRMSGNVWKVMSAFLKITGVATQQTVGIDFRASGGTDGIDNARILAFLIPDPSSADIQYSETLATTTDTVNPTDAQTLTFTPTSAGDYVWLLNGFHKEGPGGAANGGLIAEDETSTDQQISQETYLSTAGDGFVPLTHFEQRTLAASSQSFIIRHQPDTTSGSDRQGLTQLLFRSDVFEAVETADSAGLSETSSTAYQEKVSLLTASQSSNRDYVYLVVVMNDDTSGANLDNASFAEIRWDAVQQLEEEKAMDRSSYDSQLAWGYAESAQGNKVIDARFRADTGTVTTQTQYAHVLALRYKEPSVILSSAWWNNSWASRQQLTFNNSQTSTTTVEVRVSAGTDDAEEAMGTGSIDITSGDLELIRAGTSNTQEMGMRFTNLQVPQAATITNAYVEFRADEAQSEATTIVFYAEDQDDTVTFSSGANNISSRTKTTASARWDSVPSWSIWDLHQSADISPIIQEVIDRPGWASGNALVVIAKGRGQRAAESFNGNASAEAPLLHVEYKDSLKGFPVLVALNSNRVDYAKTRDSGEDIRFVDEDSATALPFQIERWNESGTSSVWVNVTQIDGGSTTDHIWLYYDNATVGDGQNPTSVWESGYVGVWHLNETPTGSSNDIQDSSANAHHGTSQGSMGAADQVAGVIDGSLDFDDIDDLVNLGNSTDFDLGTYSWTMWIQTDHAPTGGENEQPLWNGNQQFQFNWNHGGAGFRGAATHNDGAWQTAQIVTALQADTWYLISATYDGTNLRIYLNGSLEDTQAAGTPQTTDTDFTFGNDPFNLAFAGLLDEIRVSNLARSGDWLAAQNLSMTDAYLTFGDEERHDAEVQIYVSVYHTRTDGSDAQQIVNSSVQSIGNSSSDPLAVAIGSGAQQTFSEDRLLRLRVHVPALNPDERFVLAYDSASDPSSLDTPAVIGSGPDLTNPTLNPTSGSPTTFFNFTIDYSHTNGVAANVVRANVSDATNGTYNNFTTSPVDTPERDYFVQENWALNGTVTNFANAQSSTDSGASALLEQETSSSSPPTVQSVTGANDSAVDNVTVNNVPGGTDQLYLVVVHLYTTGGSPGTSEVSSIVGGGLTWALVSGTVGCTGRISQPRIEWWWAYGSPSTFDATVTLNNVAGTVGLNVAVTRIDGAANEAPSNGIYANTNGDTGACSGGTDNATLVLNMTVSNPNSLVLNSAHPRNRPDGVSTPDADYTEDYEFIYFSGGSASTIWLGHRTTSPSPGTETIVHSLGGTEPWIMVGAEIRAACCGLGTIAFDAANSATGTSNPLTFSHTVGGGENRLLVVGVGAEGGSTSNDVTDITYNGISLTKAVERTVGSSTFQNVELWYLLEADLPAAGTYTVSVTIAGTPGEINAWSISVTGAAQQAPQATASNDDGQAGDDWIETQITTFTDGAWIFDTVGSGNAVSGFTNNSGQIERADVTGTTSGLAGGSKEIAVAGAQTINWTTSGSNRIAHVLAAWAPAALAGQSALLVQFNTTGIRSSGDDTLVLRYNLTSSDDTFGLWVWNFTAADWAQRGTLDQTSLSYFNYSLTSDEKSSGEVRIRFNDTSDAGATNLSVDFQLVNNTLWRTGVTYYVNTTLAAGWYSHFFWANDTNGAGNKTATFAGPSVNAGPVLSNFRLENATAASRVGEQLDVDVDYFFLFNVTDENGWTDIGDNGNVSLRLWYDGNQTPEFTYDQQTTGANYRIELKYVDTVDPSTASLSEWSVTAGRATYNESASSLTAITNGYEFKLALRLGFQVKQANDPTDNSAGDYNDNNSWNAELVASDGTETSTLQTASTGEHLEFGVYMFTFVNISMNWTVNVNVGQTGNTNTVTVYYRSNDDLKMTIWFTTHLVNGSDTIDIANVQILAAADPNDNITADFAFTGLGQANGTYIFGSATWWFAHNASADENTVSVQFSVTVPYGTLNGDYTANLTIRIEQRPQS